MSILLNGTDQWAHRSTNPDMSLSWSMVVWARRDTTGIAAQLVAGLGASTFATRQFATYQTNRCRIQHAGSSGFAGLWDTAGEWAFMLLTYDSGTMRLRSLLSGESDWSADIGEITGLSDLTPDGFVVGSQDPASAAAVFDGPIATVKIWEGRVLTDTEALAEREYRLPVAHEADVWAAYKFDSGSLGVDSSGNSRTLTLEGSPTFTSDEPTEILGDSPVTGVVLTLPTVL